jgi:hypothetical protein
MSGQRPTAEELVAAVRGFLEQEVAGQLTGATAFNLRIAVNVLAIVERELAAADDSTAATARLGALLGADPGLGREALEEQLVAALQSGALGLASPGLLAHLRADAVRQLGIDNPRYGSYRRETAEP